MAIVCKQCSAPLPVAAAVGALVTCAFCDATQSLPREVTQASGRPFSALDFRTSEMPGWRGTKHCTYQFGGAPPALRARFETDIGTRLYTALKTQGVFDDVDAAVSISFQEGDPGDAKRVGIRAGVALRTEVGSQHCYIVNITNDGYYRVGKIITVDGAFKFKTVLKWTRSGALDPTWGSTNRLRVVADGARLQIYLNDQLATSLRDDSHQQGLIELVVNPAGSPCEVWFSDLRLAHP